MPQVRHPPPRTMTAEEAPHSNDRRELEPSRREATGIPSKGDQPTITVVVPTYNRPDYLRSCLESLAHQTMPPGDYEVVVVDDGSAPPAEEVVRSRLSGTEVAWRYVRANHRGPAAARNLGIKQAKGEIVAFIDDDCVADRLWLHGLLAPFSDPRVGAVEGAVLPMGEPQPFDRFVQNISGRRYLTANMAYRRDVFHEIGLFDEGYPAAGSEDLDIAFRHLEAGRKVEFRRDAVVYHRLHRSSLGGYRATRRLWLSNFRLYVKNPKQYEEHTGHTLLGNLIFRSFLVPNYELLVCLYRGLVNKESFIYLLGRACLDFVAGLKLLVPALLITLLTKVGSRPPMPEQEDVFESLKSWHATHNATARMTSWVEKLRIHGRTLDVGCGFGHFLSLLPPPALGLDSDPRMLAEARKTFPNIAVVCGDATHLPVRDGQMDWVTAIEVIEHLRDVDAFLAEVRRVLKPRGKLFLTTPNRLGHLRPRAPLRAILGLLGIVRFAPGHVREYTRWEIREILGENGFALVSLEETEKLPWPFRPLSGLLSAGFIVVASSSGAPPT